MNRNDHDEYDDETLKNGQKEAKAIRRIFDANTGQLAGWVYRWNTGQELPRWINGPVQDVTYS